MLVLFKFRSDPDVLTEPSTTAVVPSALNTRKHPAVPVALAAVVVIALAVNAPPLTAPNAVAEHGRDTKTDPDAAVATLTGCRPV